MFCVPLDPVFAPEFKYRERMTHYSDGQHTTIILNCSVKGTSLTVSWYKNRHKLCKSDKVGALPTLRILTILVMIL